jgi:hypothetical protein
MRTAPVLILAYGLLIQGCAKAPDPDVTRQKELAVILKPLLKPPVISFWSEDYDEPPGWDEPMNRQALRNFIAKYPETEEVYQAEIWLAFASAYTERRPVAVDERSRTAELAERLKIISQKTARSGTEKMAKLERAFRLFAEDNEDHTRFEKQADEILGHIKEYESERDQEFLRYLNVLEMRPSEIEPNLRLLVVYEKCYDHHLDKALELAKELKQKYPAWEPRSVNSEIEMIELYKRGWTPENSFRSLSKN